MKEIDEIYESLLFSIPQNNLGMEYKYGFQHGITLFKKAIDNSSVFSGQMRKKGKWLLYAQRNGIETGSECSQCGYHIYIPPQYGHNFCPNCGADMRGNEDE